MLVAIVVVALSLALSGESSECQSECRDLVFPSFQCKASFEFVFVLLQIRGIGSLPSSPDRRDCNRDTLARSLETLCTSECASSLSTFASCTADVKFFLFAGQNLSNTIPLYCSRHADGTFCPVKLLEESTGTSPVPLCTPGLPNTCNNSTCQESYRRLSSRLGCCGGTLFTNPSSPLSRFEQYFTACNATLEDSCEPASLEVVEPISSPEPTSSPEPASGSGAGQVLYLSILLIVAASLLSTII